MYAYPHYVKISTFAVLSGCVLLAACTSTSLPIANPNVAPAAAQPLRSKTFAYTGQPQKFRVPMGVTHVTVVARGAGSQSARGGLVQAIIPVTPGESLTIFVGGTPAETLGGYNGGGDGATGGTQDGRGGGGASDVRQGGIALADRVLVAGGAGGRAVGDTEARVAEAPVRAAALKGGTEIAAAPALDRPARDTADTRVAAGRRPSAGRADSAAEQTPADSPEPPAPLVS